MSHYYNNADEAAALDRVLDGSLSFWDGQPLSACPYHAKGSPDRQRWEKMWLASAEESRRTLMENKNLLLEARTIRAALVQTIDMIARIPRQIAKIPPGLRMDLNNTRRLSESALLYVPGGGSAPASGE